MLRAFFLPWRNSPQWVRPPYCAGFTITFRHTIFISTPLYEWSARRRSHGLVIVEDSRSHSDTPHLVGLLYMSDQPVAETETSCRGFTITLRHTTLGRTPLYEWSARRRDQGLLIAEDLRSHSDTPHSVALLCTSDQPVAETSTWKHTTFTRYKHPCPRRDSNPLSQQASGHRSTP